ncbi:MAG: hypothetical protein ACLP62_14040 [Acidimicrobiales bacterium]
MIWLAWRQFRTQFLVGLGLLVAVAVALAATGPSILHLYDTTVAGCAARGDCQSALSNFEDKTRWAVGVEDLVLFAPALLGIFWGAPLVARELETGTFRLAWTQSVTRSRWVVVKLVLGTVAAMVVAAALVLMVAWWSSPIDRLHSSPFSAFDRRGLLPVAYAGFAVVLGVALGVLVRRTVPAMAAALGVFAAARLLVGTWIRPRLLPPVHLVTAYFGPTPNGSATTLAQVPGQPSAWVVSTQIVDRAGHVVGHNGGVGPNGNFEFRQNNGGTATFMGMGRCPNHFPSVRATPTPPGLPHAVRECVASFHLHSVLAYQPADRYWALQGLEAAVFVVAALLLAGFTLWWVRKKVL